MTTREKAGRWTMPYPCPDLSTGVKARDAFVDLVERTRAWGFDVAH